MAVGLLSLLRTNAEAGGGRVHEEHGGVLRARALVLRGEGDALGVFTDKYVHGRSHESGEVLEPACVQRHQSHDTKEGAFPRVFGWYLVEVASYSCYTREML